MFFFAPVVLGSGISALAELFKAQGGRNTAKWATEKTARCAYCQTRVDPQAPRCGSCGAPR